MDNVIFKNARIIDGMGNPWFKGSVAIEDGQISEVGRVIRKKAREIDVNGLYICPGFIDVHCHPDFTVLDRSNPRDFKLRQGITTEVGGNCGESAAPIDPTNLDLLKAYVSFESPRDGILSWEWQTFGEYLDTLDNFGIPTNFVPLVGHGTIRIATMGFDNRLPSAQELNQMRGYVEEAMEAGAFGLSVGLGYAPGAFADIDEIVNLAKVAAQYGTIFATHMRNYSKEILESLNESFGVARGAGIPVLISHIGVQGIDSGNLMHKALTALESAREEGLDVNADVQVYTSGGTTLRVLIPHWASEGSLEDLFRRLRDPVTRSKIKAEMNGQGRSSEPTPAAHNWEHIRIGRVVTKSNQIFQGMSIAEISRVKNTDAAETVMDLVLEERCQVSMVTESKREEDVQAALAHPLTMVETDAEGYVEGSPAPRQYGTFPRVLGRYVRDKKLIRLEEAIRKMTSYPAQTMKIPNKGIIRKGADADLVVFNAETVIDVSTLDDPKRYPKGIEYVVVNGKIVVEEGEYNGKMVGRVVRKHN